MTKLVVQSLWVGDELSRMEYYSIKSFLVLGYEFHLYTYNYVKILINILNLRSIMRI